MGPMNPRSSFVLLCSLLSVCGCAGAGAAGGAGAGASAAAAPTSATAGGTTLVAIAPPAKAPPSLLDFLGIPQIMAAHQANHAKKSAFLYSILGNLINAFPPFEPPPPPTSLTDPANAGPDAPPASQAAASVKAQEDAADQKIKALNYLATIGCTKGYPEIEEAFVSALDDPTERVRYTAVRALRDVAGSPCEACKSGGSCCTPAILRKLDRLANEMDEFGCPVEPSARVRREARLAMNRCGGNVPAESPEEIEGPVPMPDPVSRRDQNSDNEIELTSHSDSDETDDRDRTADVDDTPGRRAKRTRRSVGLFDY